jgi:hypothetical protein
MVSRLGRAVMSRLGRVIGVTAGTVGLFCGGAA